MLKYHYLVHESKRGGRWTVSASELDLNVLEDAAPVAMFWFQTETNANNAMETAELAHSDKQALKGLLRAVLADQRGEEVEARHGHLVKAHGYGEPGKASPPKPVNHKQLRKAKKSSRQRRKH
jgi:hypothetical protein